MIEGKRWGNFLQPQEEKIARRRHEDDATATFQIDLLRLGPLLSLLLFFVRDRKLRRPRRRLLLISTSNSCSGKAPAAA
jgi:hypothetical protein